MRRLRDFDEELFWNTLRDDFFEEGRKEGRNEAVLSMLNGLVAKGYITLGQAATEARLTVPEFERKVAELKK